MYVAIPTTTTFLTNTISKLPNIQTLFLICQVPNQICMIQFDLKLQTRFCQHKTE